MRKTLLLPFFGWILLCAALFGPGFNSETWAQTFTAANLTYTQDFNSLPFSGTATWTDNATLPGWVSNRTTLLVSSGTNNAGSLYSFGSDASAERALGSVASGGAAPIYGVVLTNGSGSPISSLTVTYTGEQWRNGGNATQQKLSFSYSTGATVTLTSTATAVETLDFTGPVATTIVSPLDGNAAANRTTLTQVVTFATPVADGEQILLRWTDVNDPGSDHGLAVDDLSVTAGLAVPLATLTANPTTLTGFAATQGQVSAPQVYTLTGSNLSANALVTAPAGFEVSTNGSAYSTTATVPQTSSAISQTVAVRLTNAAPAGTVNGTITNVSGPATATVMVSGNVTAPTPGKVVISQVYGGGGNSGATYRNDFIELFNAGGTTVDVTGWSVQYASAAGTVNSSGTTSLTGTIGPGKYYLIQEAAGNAGTTDLPTPDVIGTIAMAATAGKVALVNTTATLSGTCPTGAAVIDYVGFGSAASCFEGAGPTPAPSNTNAVVRASDGCTDTDNNAADFATGTPTPRNSASPANVCTVTPPIQPVLTATPNALNIAYTQGSGPASATVLVSGSAFNAASGTITAVSSSTAFTVSPASVPFSGSALAATPFAVTLTAGLPVASYSGNITFAGGGATAVVPVAGTVSASVPGGITPIATARTQVGQTVTIQGTVTVSGQLGNKQLYVEDNTGGVLVFSGSGDDYTTQTQIGDVVKLTGPVSVYQGGIEINGVQAFTLVSTGNPAPTPTPITLDQIGNYQGQLVRITGASVTPASTTFSAGNTTLNADNTTGTLRIGSNSGLVGAGQPSAPFSITGIADRFVANATTTGTDNIQLLPRQLSDVEGATPPVFEDVFCGTPITSGTLTQDQTFDFAAFNVEFFGASAGTISCPNGNLQYQNQGPVNEALQAQNVKKVLMAINADVFVLEEVSDQNLLQTNLPAGYALSCSDRFSYYFQDECAQTPTNGFVFGPTKFAQKVCVAYNTTTVTSVSASPLLSDYYGYGPSGPASGSTNNWSSGRLPYLFVADATVNGVTRRLNIIGIHAKSGSATSDYNRRRQDVLDLYNLLTNSSTGPGPLGAGFPKESIIIAGDYNDNITGSIAANQQSSYKPFVDDAANFRALTQPLEDEQGCNTFFNAAGNTSFLDHIVISDELFNAYVPGSVSIQTSFSAITSNFTTTTSDHRPVFARFDLSKIAGPLSATLLASTSVCAGSPASFSLTVAGLGTGTTYSYTISNGTNSTTAAGVSASAVLTSVVPTVVGSFTATVLTSANASTTAASGNVTINALPDAPVLTGVSRTVTQSNTPLPLSQFVSATGSNTLSFSGVNGALNPPNADVSQAGQQSFSVTQTGGNGCVSPATPFTITVQQRVTTSPGSQTVCRSSRVVLRATTAGVRYEWYKNGQSAPFKLTEIASIQKGTATSSLTVVSIQTSAPYYVKVFQADGSFSFDGPFQVTVNYGCVAPGARLAAAEEAGVPLSVVLTPNPVVDGQLRAVIRGASGAALSIKLVDLWGQSVRSQQWSATDAERVVEWNIAAQPAGLYLLQVQTPDQFKTIKVIHR